MENARKDHNVIVIILFSANSIKPKRDLVHVETIVVSSTVPLRTHLAGGVQLPPPTNEARKRLQGRRTSPAVLLAAPLAMTSMATRSRNKRKRSMGSALLTANQNLLRNWKVIHQRQEKNLATTATATDRRWNSQATKACKT